MCASSSSEWQSAVQPLFVDKTGYSYLRIKHTVSAIAPLRLVYTISSEILMPSETIILLDICLDLKWFIVELSVSHTCHFLYFFYVKVGIYYFVLNHKNSPSFFSVSHPALCLVFFGSVLCIVCTHHFFLLLSFENPQKTKIWLIESCNTTTMDHFSRRSNQWENFQLIRASLN